MIFFVILYCYKVLRNVFEKCYIIRESEIVFLEDFKFILLKNVTLIETVSVQIFLEYEVTFLRNTYRIYREKLKF